MVRAELDQGTISIPRTEFEQGLANTGVFTVRAAGLPIAIVVRRLENGRMVALSTICTHAGCEVRVLPKQFTCPCHGSEFDEQGEVLEGPAEDPLQSFEVTEKENSIEIKVS